jgi:high affinity Mn2+ porin
MTVKSFSLRLSQARFAWLALGAAAITDPLAAAEAGARAVPLLQTPYDWSGLYVGFHSGYASGRYGPGTDPLLARGEVFPPGLLGLIGGWSIGLNRQFSNNLVLGIEADASFGGPADHARNMPRPFVNSTDYLATLRGRAGYTIGAVMPYVTGGLAVGRTHIHPSDGDGGLAKERPQHHIGWTAGLGIEAALDSAWSTKLEYSYVDLNRRSTDLTDVGLGVVNVAPQIHVLKAGLNYRIWDAPFGASYRPRVQLPEASDWSIHGQMTFIPQVYPGIRSPYEGGNSLPGGGQGRETFTTSAFLGWKLWRGGEVWFNPELAQGFGLNSTLGIAGFSNGEAQKGGAPFPRFRAQRYFIRQTFGLGGEQEEVSDAAFQFAGKRDIDRITVTAGRFAVGDFFDGNAYAKDPRADFMNWSLWASAAYDFPADLPGFTRGGVVELNKKDWAVRVGLFQVPSAPNSDTLTFNTGGTVAEFEGRYAIADQPGRFRVGVFLNRGNTGSYRSALGQVAMDPRIDINDAIVNLRQVRTKYGFYLNGEQQLMKDVGLFGRFSWNDGRNEILSFTDIDRSLSGGVSIKGSYWGRPTDTIGLGGAVNGLSSAHRDFLAAGGLGLLIGDGRLTYANERILETYYAYNVNRNVTFTADYQLIANPAYNADRGPVSVFSGRLHGEF